MKQDRINHHEDWQTASFREFLTEYWYRYRGTAMPLFRDANAVVEPTVNHGRWVMDCLNPTCSEATVVSANTPYYICVKCGSPENEGRFYEVIFPTDKGLIEQVLLRRPNVRNRNWVKAESVADLYRENREEVYY